MKGLWTRLLSPSEALLRSHRCLPEDRELPGETYRSRPLWTQLARCLRFKLEAVFRRRRADHINLKELESYLAAEEALAPSVWESSRTISMLDSQVCIMEGRSASFSINPRMRSSLPCLLFFNLHPRYAYIASEDNAADDPTRSRPVRAPTLAEPLWLRRAEVGDFGELDRFLTAWGLEPLQLQDISELLQQFESRDRSPAFLPRISEPAPLSGAVLSSAALPPQAAAAPEAVPLSASVLAPATVLSGRPSPGLSLASPALDFLRSCKPRQFLWPSGLTPQLSKRFLQPGYICLYAGNRGVAKEVMKRCALPWALTFDWFHGPSQALLDESLQVALLAAAEARCFAAAGLAPICASFSTAITPAVQSCEFPLGLPALSPAMAVKVAQGNAHCTFVVRFVRVLLRLGVPFWLENPDGSWLWRQPAFVQLFQDYPELGFWRYDCCRYGSLWRKRTKVLTTTALAGSVRLCLGGHELRGRSKKYKMAWTAVAESYPLGVCRDLAMAVCDAAAAADRTVSSCVRDGCKRIGGASVPGPSRRRPARTGSLFDVELVEQSTVRLRVHIWDTFKAWFREALSESAVLALFRCAQLLA